MDEKMTYGASVAFSCLALVLFVVNFSLLNSNRHMQEEIGQNQALISRAVNLSQTNQALVQSLAEIAVKENNSAVKDLLAAQGITINPEAATKAKEAVDAKKSAK
jgi:hypothetical protein